MNIVYMAKSAWTGLLDTIRSKAGVTGSMTVSQAADAVESISGGGGSEDVKAFIERGALSLYNSEASRVGAQAFLSWTSGLTYVNMLNVTTISTQAFMNCKSLETAIFNNVKSIASQAFNSCIKLESVNMPLLSSAQSNVFANCSALTSVSFPLLDSIQTNLFVKCSTLNNVYLPNASFIGQSAFAYCGELEHADFLSGVKTIGSSAFQSCSKLQSVNAPVASVVSTGAFSDCTALSTATFGSNALIYGYAFFRCYNLLSLNLLASSVCRLSNTTALSSTPIEGYTTSTGGVYGSIFVPASLYDQYISATNWSVFSSRFVSV